MDADMIVLDFRGDIEPSDLEDLNALVKDDDASEVMLTSQLSGESILKIVVSITKLGPKLLASLQSVVRPDNIKTIKIETKQLKLTIENVNPTHFEALGEFIIKIKDS